MKAFCSGCGLSSVPSPSSVVTSFPSIEPTGVTKECLAAPLTSTVQAPHCVMAQPYLAPLSSRSLRSTYSSGVSGSASIERIAPLTLRLMAIAGVLHPHLQHVVVRRLRVRHVDALQLDAVAVLGLLQVVDIGAGEVAHVVAPELHHVEARARDDVAVRRFLLDHHVA